MTIEQAIEILRTHNEWRRGAEDIQPYAPSVIGEAIDVVVRYHSVESNEVVADVLSTLTTRYAIKAVVLVKQQVAVTEYDLYAFLEEQPCVG